MKRRKPLQEVFYTLCLLAAVVVVFIWYTMQNSSRMEERNKNYAADSARLKASQVDDELNNALNMIKDHTYFVGEGLTEPAVTAGMLKEMEENSRFDTLMFTDLEGIDHASDGRTADVTDRDFYYNGIKGEIGISVIFDPHILDDIMVCFYAPVRYNDEIIGVLRGAYLTEEYMKEMLSTTYFGEQADVFLCTPEGRVIACSGDMTYTEHLVDVLTDSGVIDDHTAGEVRDVFENGGEKALVCSSESRTDNICVRYLADNEFVLVQTFPKNVTQNMIRDENLVGIQLEMMLIGLFVIYIFILLIRAGRQKKLLEQENREMGYIINGVNTLFSRFAMINFETDTYHYLAGTKPEEGNIADSGSYQELVDHWRSIMIEDEMREGFIKLVEKEAVINALEQQNDLRIECHVMRKGRPEWEHMNMICLERKDGKASKILYIRQNITEVKEKELRIQAEMSLANRKERQYQIAITESSFCTFEFNLTQDLIGQDIVRTINGKQISLLEKVGLEAPCKASECFEKWKPFILEDSMEEYQSVVNVDKLKEHFEQGDTEVDVDYWGWEADGEQICVRQSFIMTQDNDTKDIMVMVVSKEITESVRKQKEQTQ